MICTPSNVCVSGAAAVEAAVANVSSAVELVVASAAALQPASLLRTATACATSVHVEQVLRAARVVEAADRLPHAR